MRSTAWLMIAVFFLLCNLGDVAFAAASLLSQQESRGSTAVSSGWDRGKGHLMKWLPNARKNNSDCY